MLNIDCILCLAALKDHLRIFENFLHENHSCEIKHTPPLLKEFLVENFRNFLNVIVENSITIFTRKHHIDPKSHTPPRSRLSCTKFSKLYLVPEYRMAELRSRQGV